MKRGVFAFALVVMLAAGGCSATAGDGDLADDWQPMASAAPLVPATEACYSATSRARDSIAPTKWLATLPCTDKHGAETFHVGQFPASVAAAPVDGDKDYRTAFDDCQKVSKTYLGGDWYSARVYITVFVPFKTQWEAGARWYACQAMETQNVTSSTVVQRTGSLKNALATPGLAHGCTNVVGLKETDWDDMTAIDCAQPHDAEYAGAFVVPGNDYPSKAQVESVLDGCWNVVAAFMGGSVDGIQAGYIPFGLVQKDWARGHRYVRCWAWSDEYKTVGSAKGIGNKAMARA